MDRKHMRSSALEIEAVDLYCGAGGLTCGLQAAGIKVLAGYDLDDSCTFAFEKNNSTRFVRKDIADVSGRELENLFTRGAITMLAGCAPCQPFSSYMKGYVPEQHAKWGLLREFERLVSEVVPDLVTMENVPKLIRHLPFRNFLATLADLDYCVTWEIVDCADFGVPQHRKRLVLLASRLGAVSFPRKTHKGRWKVAGSVLSKFPVLAAGTSDAKDSLHCAATLSPLNAKRIAHSKPGGTWHDWPSELVARCHTVERGKSFKSVYGRMASDAPAPTMTTLCFGFGNGRFGHPDQPRAISLREAAALQSFPPLYEFTAPGDKCTFKGVGRMIGNAVPPALGAAIGRTLVRHVSRSVKPRE